MKIRKDGNIPQVEVMFRAAPYTGLYGNRIEFLALVREDIALLLDTFNSLVWSVYFGVELQSFFCVFFCKSKPFSNPELIRVIYDCFHTNTWRISFLYFFFLKRNSFTRSFFPSMFSYWDRINEIWITKVIQAKPFGASSRSKMRKML